MRAPVNYTKHLLVKGLRLRYQQTAFSSGMRSINLRCLEPGCLSKCVMSFSIPSELWNVPAERLAEKLCSLCVGLAREAERTAKRDGRLTQGSLVLVKEGK